MRFAHIFAVVLLLGAALYLSATRQTVSAAYRNVIYVGLALVVGSGLYNFFQKAAFPKGYHMVFGIKMLLVLHVGAVYVLIATGQGDDTKRARWVKGIALSGTGILLLSAVLRNLSLG